MNDDVRNELYAEYQEAWMNGKVKSEPDDQEVPVECYEDGPEYDKGLRKILEASMIKEMLAVSAEITDLVRGWK
jgi:hypothetical protein